VLSRVQKPSSYDPVREAIAKTLLVFAISTEKRTVLMFDQTYFKPSNETNDILVDVHSERQEVNQLN